jgi:hypothetical protein
MISGAGRRPSVWRFHEEAGGPVSSDADAAISLPQQRPPRKPRAIVRVLAMLLLVLFLIALAETFFAAYCFMVEGEWIWPARRWEIQQNRFVSDLTSGACRYIDALYPHPYLVYVNNGNPPCPGDFINAKGLSGRDLPLKRDPDAFAILLTGGSVAAQFGQIKNRGPLFLEEELNSCYKPPKGSRFVVYNGAVGGWRQPQQTIISMLYGDEVDGIVTLEGINEFQFLAIMRLEMPNGHFELLNPLALRSTRGIVASAISSQVQIMVSSSPLRHSFTAYFLVDRLRGWLSRIANEALGRRKTSFVRLFELPENWTKEQRIAFNIEQYRKYLHLIDAIAKSEGARAAFFIQPVAAIGKTLTSEEKETAGEPDYGPGYQQMADALLETRKEGLQIFSLLDVFQNTSDTVYADLAHQAFDPVTRESRGNRILASAIAQRLAAIWSFERKCH